MARTVNYLPTSTSTIRGKLGASSITPTPDGGTGATCLASKPITYKAKYASKRRVGR